MAITVNRGFDIQPVLTNPPFCFNPQLAFSIFNCLRYVTPVFDSTYGLPIDDTIKIDMKDRSIISFYVNMPANERFHKIAKAIALSYSSDMNNVYCRRNGPNAFKIYSNELRTDKKFLYFEYSLEGQNQVKITMEFGSCKK